MIVNDYSFKEFLILGKCTKERNKASVSLCEDVDSALQEALRVYSYSPL